MNDPEALTLSSIQSFLKVYVLQYSGQTQPIMLKLNYTNGADP